MKKKTHNKDKAKGFMSGVLILSVSTLIVKFIGLAFKIPMLSFLGAEGMGYFNSAYEIYALLCIISTAGLPVALSMLVSAARARNDGSGIKNTYRTAMGIFLVFGICGSIIMLCFSGPLADFIGNPKARLCIIAIAPALLFICVASALRGYCQGFEHMTPTAVSQLIEALSKLGFGILFAVVAIKKNLPVYSVAACAVLGVTLGTLLSSLYLAVEKRRITKCNIIQGTLSSKRRSGTGELIKIALPITLGSALMGVTRIIDMTMIMRRLQDTGTSALEANKIYGSYTTLAVPVFSLVPALITPVAMALVPQLAAYREQGNHEGQASVIERSLRITVLLAMPASLCLTVYARPMLELLFSNQTEAVDISAPLLSVLGASVIFSCLITTSNAILQSYRKAYLPIISMAIGVAVKLVASYILIGNAKIGAMGAPIGSLLCNASVILINFLFMYGNTHARLSIFNVFFKPLAAAMLSVGGGFALYVFLLNTTQGGKSLLFVALGTTLVLYFAFSWLIKSITIEDIALLPFGDGLCNKILKNKKYSEEENDGSTKEKDAS